MAEMFARTLSMNNLPKKCLVIQFKSIKKALDGENLQSL